MNKELSKEETVREAEEILRRSRWENLIKAKNEEKTLSEQDERALEIREICISVADRIDQLLHDPTIKNDPVKEAEVIADYSQGIHRLQELGITENMHAGDPEESFNYPAKLAEYVAGQLLTTREVQIPAEGEILSQVEVQVDNVALMRTKFITPKLEDFMVMYAVADWTYVLLYSELDESTK